MVQQIVETLKKNNQLENTIIIFTSDNGCAPYIGVEEMEIKGITQVTSTEVIKTTFMKVGTVFHSSFPGKENIRTKPTVHWYHSPTSMPPLPKW